MALTVRSDAFKLLEPYPRFVVYGTAPRAGQSGKLDKFPIDPRNGSRLVGWNTEEQWLTLDDAFRMASDRPDHWGVGFVLDRSTDLHFLDIDGCTTGGQWSPEVLELIDRFPGAFIETSLSGQGLHVIFYASDLPEHGTRCFYNGLSLELYSSDRFCACTGNCWSRGPQLLDNGPSGRSLAAEFPSRTNPAKLDVEWVNEPLLACHLPDDDSEVIRRILNDDY